MISREMILSIFESSFNFPLPTPPPSNKTSFSRVCGRKKEREQLHFVNLMLSTGDLRAEGGTYFKTPPLPLRKRQFWGK